jgi:hypothetical protein
VSAVCSCDAVLVDRDEASGPVELPLACTLGAEDGAARLRRWRAFAERSRPRSQRLAHRLEIRWRVDADGASELGALVAAERECCAFVTWSVSREDPDAILEITSDASRPEDLDAISQLFSAS